MDNYLPIECIAYGVRDSYGNTWGGVASDIYDAAQVYGLMDADGETLSLESDYRHIEGWCKTNSLEYTSSKVIVGVTFPSKDNQ